MTRRKATHPRNVCFVTGTRAEFGLMETTLRAIQSHPKLKLQLVATGMHLSRRHGYTVNEIQARGWRVDVTVPWRGGPAVATGSVVAKLATAFETLRSDVVLIVGDRVEAFAAAAAGHLSGRVVAHVHGGDRALGQMDDALRHAITKLAHVHFPATPQSAERLMKLGEDAWRIHLAGAPGIDGITQQATRRQFYDEPYGLVVLHPASPQPAKEQVNAMRVLEGVLQSGCPRVLIVYPNNDPGAQGIADYWDQMQPEGVRCEVVRNLSRHDFLAHLRDAAFILGNSSSGIIEAASFGTPVIDVGPRQAGREHGDNVRHVDYTSAQIARVIRQCMNHRFPKRNLYGGRGTGRKIASVLGRLIINPRLQRKLIAY